MGVDGQQYLHKLLAPRLHLPTPVLFKVQVETES